MSVAGRKGRDRVRIWKCPNPPHRRFDNDQSRRQARMEGRPTSLRFLNHLMMQDRQADEGVKRMRSYCAQPYELMEYAPVEQRPRRNSTRHNHGLEEI